MARVAQDIDKKCSQEIKSLGNEGWPQGPLRNDLFVDAKVLYNPSCCNVLLKEPQRGVVGDGYLGINRMLPPNFLNAGPAVLLLDVILVINLEIVEQQAGSIHK